MIQWHRPSLTSPGSSNELFGVNMEVKRMIKTDGGYAVMNDESMIGISPKKKDDFMLQIGQRLL